MKMKMLRTTQGSPDGISVNLYEMGKEYDLSDSLAKAFLSMKIAESAERKEQNAKTKDAGAAKENK